MINVLVVDDDAVALAAHGAYVQRMPGFALAGTAQSATEAIRFLATDGATVDLVLLDVNMPDASGLAVVRRMRSLGIMTDVIAVTGVRDLATVRSALSLGVLNYVLKPFTFATLAQRLNAYADYRVRLAGGTEAVCQGQIDAVVGKLHATGPHDLPKGLSEAILVATSSYIKQAARWVSAHEVSDALGVSRVTARRYLEFLVGAGVTIRQSKAQGHGRPTVLYRWLNPTSLSLRQEAE